MNMDNYLNIIMVAFLGMGVVFVFLGFLSLVMAGLSVLVPKKAGGRARKSVKDENDSFSRNATNNDNDKIPGWLLAAVAAYLSQEKNEQPSRALLWKRRKNEKKEGWVILHTLQAKKTGAF